MGWKSTKIIKRKEAITLILDRITDMSNEELSDALLGLGYGDNTELKYYGRNFLIIDDDNHEIDDY